MEFEKREYVSSGRHSFFIVKFILAGKRLQNTGQLQINIVDTSTGNFNACYANIIRNYAIGCK